jgi:tetratricopeptide (TPR) repeat protein
MWKEAVDAEKKALSIDSSFTNANMNLKYALSMQNSDKGTNSEPKYLYQAVQYYQEGKYEDCVTVCKKCLSIDSTSYVAWNNLGSAYISLVL